MESRIKKSLKKLLSEKNELKKAFDNPNELKKIANELLKVADEIEYKNQAYIAKEDIYKIDFDYIIDNIHSAIEFYDTNNVVNGIVVCNEEEKRKLIDMIISQVAMQINKSTILIANKDDRVVYDEHYNEYSIGDLTIIDDIRKYLIEEKNI